MRRRHQLMSTVNNFVCCLERVTFFISYKMSIFVFLFTHIS